MGLAGQIIEYRRGQKQLDDGNYRVVEGMVRDFIPMPPGGHSIESFKVGETPFHYGSGWGSIRFNSEFNRGYIRDGATVRITYNDGGILRVEVRR
jgi:hypothetical protein